MKNKHLVLLFLSALLIGWITGRLPWTKRTVLPEVDLLQVDTQQLVEINIHKAHKSALTLNKTDEGWIISQEGLHTILPPDVVQGIMRLLHPFPAAQVVHTDRMDTLGLAPDEGIWLRFQLKNGRSDSIRIGRIADGFTWIALPGHEGIYKIGKDLNLIAQLAVRKFQSGVLLELDTSALEACSVAIPPSDFTGLLRFSDSLQCWTEETTLHRVASDSMQQWMRLLPFLNQSTVTRFFDESRRAERFGGTVSLHGGFGVINLRFYKLPFPDLPDDMISSPAKPLLAPCYVVESTQRPNVYYAVYDTVLVHRILHDLLPKQVLHE